MGLTAKNGREMPAHRSPVEITDKIGRKTTVWRGKKQADKNAGQSRQSLDDDRKAASNSKRGRSNSKTIRGALWDRIKIGYGNVQTIRDYDREQRRLNDKPAGMSDWEPV